MDDFKLSTVPAKQKNFGCIESGVYKTLIQKITPRVSFDVVPYWQYWLVSIYRALNNEYMQLPDKLYFKRASTSYSQQRKPKDFKGVETCSYFGKSNRNELNCKRLHELGKRRKEIEICKCT